MIQDFKFAFRQLLKSPGFTGVAVMTLALAIGVNSAIFALINSVVLHPMVPLRPQEVVNVFNCRQNANHDYRQFSYNEYRELRENGGDLFVDLAALEFAVAGIGRDHEMRRSFAFLTSENYFSLMGVKPFRGRFYSAEEAGLNANVPVVVASYGFWKRQGGRSDFVGSTLQINGQPYTVIGIAPEGFSGASALIAPDIWVPLGVRSQLGSAFGDSCRLEVGGAQLGDRGTKSRTSLSRLDRERASGLGDKRTCSQALSMGARKVRIDGNLDAGQERFALVVGGPARGGDFVGHACFVYSCPGSGIRERPAPHLDRGPR